MSLIIKLKGNNLYIRYNQEKANDDTFSRVRTKILFLVDKEAIPNRRNLIIDFGDKKSLFSPEIGIIALVAKSLWKAKLTLTILSSSELNKYLLKTSIESIPNLHIGINSH